MIDVKIIENRGFVALCTITGDKREFEADLARIRRIPASDREFVSNAEPKYWRVRPADRYAKLVPEIDTALTWHKRQMRFPTGESK